MKRPLLGQRYARLGSYHDFLKEPVRAVARQYILEHVVTKVSLHEFQCLCGHSDRDVLLAAIDRWGLPCSSVLCRHCGIIRVNPRWGEDAYADVYSEPFWRLQMGQVAIDERRFALSIRRAEPFAQYILKHIDISGKRVLEIGCSYGAGLQVLRHACAELTGYDYDERMLDAGRRFTSLDLRRGGAAEALRDGGRYDLILLRHVFEHMLHPGEELMRIRQLLCDQGLLFIEVPGALCVGQETPDPMKMFNIFHAYTYTLDNLSCVLRSNGFRLVRGDEHIYSLWEPASECMNVQWCNPSLVERIVGHLLAMERRRRWAGFRTGLLSIAAMLRSAFHRG